MAANEWKQKRRAAAARAALLTTMLVVCTSAAAHEPIARCIAVDARTIRCQGGYGQGEGAPGATMDVVSHDGRVLVAGKLDAASTLTFARPAVGFYVLFDIGPGHQVVIEQDEIAAAPARAARPPSNPK